MNEAFVENFHFEIQSQGGEVEVNGKKLPLDLKEINPRLYHLIHENHSYDVFIHQVDKDKKEVTLSLNGKKTTVKLQSRIEKLLKELGMEAAMTKKLDSLKAPMPGLVHSWKVKEGDEVKQGDPLLILEAMKMENVIKSPGDATVTKIHVAEKASVEKNELLISFG